MKQLHLTGTWVIKAPREEVYKIISDFENMPKNFPSVAQSLKIDEFGNPLIYSGHGGGFFHWGSVIGTEDMVYTESQIKEKSEHDEEVLLVQPGFYIYAQY